MKQKQINETSWKEVELGDKNYFEIIGSGIKKFEGIKDFLSTKCIKYDKIKKIECQISFNERPSRANMQPQRDSIWFAKMQGTIKTYLFSDKNPEEIKKYILSTGFSGIRTNNLIYPKYLQFYFLTKEFNKNKDVECIGGTQKAINNSKIAKLKISLPFTLEGKPDITKQKQIATILENAKKLKDKNKIIIEDLDEYLKSVFYEMFLKGNKFQGIELGNEEYFEIVMGQSPPGNSYNEKRAGVPFFQGKKEFGEKYPTIIKWTDNPTKMSKPKDILMSVRAPVGSVNIGNVDCCIGRGLCAIRCKDKIKLDFVYDYFKIHEEEISNLGQGSTFKAITTKQLKEIKIPLPPLPLQEKFSSIVEQVEKTKEKLKQNENALGELFNSLMQKAFRGELI